MTYYFLLVHTFTLTGYTGANWAGCRDSRHSTSGDANSLAQILFLGVLVSNLLFPNLALRLNTVHWLLEAMNYFGSFISLNF